MKQEDILWEIIEVLKYIRAEIDPIEMYASNILYSILSPTMKQRQVPSEKIRFFEGAQHDINDITLSITYRIFSTIA